MLTATQEKALQLLRSKNNVFLTGPAGTGKSYLIRHYRKLFDAKIPVVSSTGAAAVLVEGRTFHSFFGLGTMNERVEVILDSAIQNEYLSRRIRSLRAIIIDEISMLPGKALDLANLICKSIRGNDLPFGGIRLICVGDFFQLPPVSPDSKTVDWAFESFTWQECKFQCIELKEFMRTKETKFLEVLANIRQGVCTLKEELFLNGCRLKPEDNFVGTRIYARKNKVQDYNEESLAKLEGKEFISKTEFRGSPEDVARLQRSLPIDEEIVLKEECLVMIRINDRTKNQDYVNGTLGYVDFIGSQQIGIKTLNNKYVILAKHLFKLTNGDGDVIAEAENFPVSLAYAITIHKSQGATIDHAVLDLTNLWDSGQAYTALSRLSQEKGLKIVNWTQKSIFVDPKVVRFYEEINEQELPEVKVTFHEDNLLKIYEGKKTSTLRSGREAEIIGLKARKSGILIIKDKKFKITNLGMVSVHEVGGKQKVWASEGFSENFKPKFQQTILFLEGKVKLNYYLIQPL